MRSPLISLALLAALVAGSEGCTAQAKTPQAPPPPKVVVAPAQERQVELFAQAVGQMDGYVNAEMRARVSGFLRTQNYRDGTAVKQNQLLFTIDATEYRAALDSARGALERAQAAVQLSKQSLARAEQLVKSGSVPQRTLDDATAASADALGQERAARAAVQQAEINLSYTQLKSPIDGMAGLALVRVGNLVGKDGPTLLTTVSQLDPMRVRFPINERDYLKNAQRYKDLSGRDLKWTRTQFKQLQDSGKTESGDEGLELVLADDSVYPQRGMIVATDREVNPNTGTITVEALFPNPDGLLRPGQYARVKMRQASSSSQLVVAQKALLEVQGTFSVAVVGEGNKVELRRVEVGPTVGEERVVSKGLKAGERIVVDGVQKVSDGAQVVPEELTAKSADDDKHAASAAPAGN